MSLDKQKKQIVDDALLEALLQQTLGQSGQSEEERIAKLFATPLSGSPQTQTVSRRPNWTRRGWVSVCIAATLLVVLSYFALGPSNSNMAYAAVTRSLQAKLPTRHYRLTMKHQAPLWGQREIVSDLYLDDQDRFVMRHPGWMNGEIWIGGDREQRWIVPRIGPARIGGEALVGNWLNRRDIPSTMLDLSTLLDRFRRRYRLVQLQNERLPLATENSKTPDGFIECVRVVGRPKFRRVGLADRIELWADAKTGIAQRLQLNWFRPKNERGPVEWTLELIERPDLEPEWFDLQSHIAEDRRVINVRTESDLISIDNNDPVDATPAS